MTKNERDEANRLTRAENLKEKKALQEIMELSLAALGWPDTMVWAFIQAELAHGVLRPSAPVWLVRSTGETWSGVLINLKSQNWIIFPK